MCILSRLCVLQHAVVCSTLHSFGIVSDLGKYELPELTMNWYSYEEITFVACTWKQKLLTKLWLLPESIVNFVTLIHNSSPSKEASRSCSVSEIYLPPLAANLERVKNPMVICQLVHQFMRLLFKGVADNEMLWLELDYLWFDWLPSYFVCPNW